VGALADEVGELAQTRRSPRLDHFVLPDEVRVHPRASTTLKDAQVIVSAIPVQFIRETWTKILPYIPEGAGIVSVAKGVEVGTGMLPTAIIRDVLRARGRTIRTSGRGDWGSERADDRAGAGAVSSGDDDRGQR
jgi:glycerol-3-phosphate dehydrogenase (NAD(P)+)